MITIDLNQIRETVEVTIGDHVFNVRRMGSGEELEVSASMRRAGELIGDISKLQSKYLKLTADNKEVDDKELEKITKKMTRAADQLEIEQKFQFERYVKLFDDGGDGSKSKELLGSISHEGRQKLLEDIFNQKTILDSQKESEGSEEAVND